MAYLRARTFGDSPVVSRTLIFTTNLQPLCMDIWCEAFCCKDINFKAVFESAPEHDIFSQQATYGLWNSAGLKMPIHTQFYQPAIWTRKVDHGDLDLMCDQGSLVGLCVQDYKSCVQRLWLVPPWLSQNVIRTFAPCDLKSSLNPRLLCIHVRCTHNANSVTAGQLPAEIR